MDKENAYKQIIGDLVCQIFVLQAEIAKLKAETEKSVES